MNIFERLTSGYPQGDVSPQDFIDHLSIGADGWIGAWVAIICSVFGNSKNKIIHSKTIRE